MLTVVVAISNLTTSREQNSAVIILCLKYRCHTGAHSTGAMPIGAILGVACLRSNGTTLSRLRILWQPLE